MGAATLLRTATHRASLSSTSSFVKSGNGGSFASLASFKSPFANTSIALTKTAFSSVSLGRVLYFFLVIPLATMTAMPAGSS
jgi:hypothetical protein